MSNRGTDPKRRAEIQTAIRDALGRLEGDRTPLDLVGEIPMIEAIVGDLIAERIDAARSQGLSWEAIALRLGISRQAAHKRFVKGRGNKKRAGRSSARLEIRVEKDST